MVDATISISASLITSTNNFVVAIYAASAPTVALQTVAPSKPYGNPFQVIFTDLDPQLLYNVILWESIDTTPSGVVRNSFSFKPSSQTTTIREDLDITADVTTGFVSGGATFSDASLVGWDWSLECAGSSTLQKGVDYTQNSDGFTLLNSRLIQSQERFIFHFLPKIADVQPPSPALISSSVTLNVNTTLDNTYVNKVIFTTGAANVIGLPPLSSITDFQQIRIYNLDPVNCSIRCNGSEKIQRDAQVSKIVLGKNESLKLFKANGVWNVDFASPGVDMVGQLVYSFSNSDANVIPLNGALVSRAIFERLWDKVQTLQSGVLIAQSSWENVDINGNKINYGKFATGDGSTTFQLPLLTKYGFLKAVDGSTRLPGSFEADAVGAFTASITGTIIKKAGTSNEIVVLNALGTEPTFGTSAVNNVPIDGGATNGTKPREVGIYVGIRI